MNAAESEAELLRVAADLLLQSGFAEFRMYSVAWCHHSKQFVANLRNMQPRLASVAPGFRVLNPSFAAQPKPYQPYFEAASTLRERAEDPHYLWIKQFHLEGYGCYDIPILDGDEVIGLLAISVLGAEEKLQRICDFFSVVAESAGSRLAAIRRAELEQVARRTQQTKPMSRRQVDLDQTLAEIKEVLGVDSLAYFAFEPHESQLVKVAERDFDLAAPDPNDHRYKLGEYLIGRAWSDPQFRYIPDFEAVRDTCANAEAVARMENVHGAKVLSVLFQRLTMADGSEGMLRAINTNARPWATLTAHHQRLLSKLGDYFASRTTSVSITQALVAAGEMFSDAIDFVRRDSDDTSFPVIRRKVFEAVHGVRVAVFGSDIAETSIGRQGSLGANYFATQVYSATTESRGWRKEPARAYTYTFPEEDFANISGIHGVKYLPQAAASVLGPDWANGLVYIKTFRSDSEDKDLGEIVLVMFLLENGGITESDKLEERVANWSARVQLQALLDIVVNIIGIARQLRKNRHLLTLASEAVGGIGHEMRKPLAAIQDHCRRLGALARSVTESIPGRLAPPVEYQVYRNRELEIHELETKDEVVNAFDSIQSEIETACRQGDRVVSDAIQWVRFQGTVIELHIEEDISLIKLIREAWRSLRQERIEHSYLKLEILDSVSRLPEIAGDPSLLLAVLVNVLDNAIKYSHSRTPKRQIEDANSSDSEIKVYGERQAESVILSVENWGLGILPEDYGNIFLPFYKSPGRDRYRTIRGVGLGLPICARFIAAHGGAMAVTSKPTLDDPKRIAAMEGYLTTFKIKLPIRQAVVSDQASKTKVLRRRVVK